eukprot:2216423-Prorocentrum_lima.AAC.1
MRRRPASDLRARPRATQFWPLHPRRWTGKSRFGPSRCQADAPLAGCLLPLRHWWLQAAAGLSLRCARALPDDSHTL